MKSEKDIQPSNPGPGLPTALAVIAAALGLAIVVSEPAEAVDLELGEVTGSFDTTVSIGASIRVQDRDSALIALVNGGSAFSANADNGNLNYDQGDLTSLAAKATHELELNYRNFSFFGRLFYFYDTVIMDTDTDRTPLSDSAEDHAGRDIELLDAYLTGDFDIGARPLTVRIGNQVLSWGESTFIQNGINIINPVDVSKLRVAGAELREALTPGPLVDATLGITENLSLEAFYQVLWDKTEIEPEGTFFSTNDFISPGARFVMLGFGVAPDFPPPAPFPTTFILRGGDREPSDQGQFGAALRYFSPELNNTEFGLYYIRHHSRLPLISAQTAADANPVVFFSDSRYFVEYPEDIDVFGTSFNTTVGTTGLALQGEVSYRHDQPLQIDDVELLFSALDPVLGTGALSQLGPAGLDEKVTGFRRKDIVQAQVTATQVLGPNLGADQVIIVGEVGLTHVLNMEDKSELRYEGPGTFTPGNPTAAGAFGVPTQTDGFADPFSWGYRIRARLDYNNAIGPINLLPGIAFAHDVNGTTPSPISNFVEGRKAITLSLAATYLNAYQANLSYTNFFDGGAFNLLNDRDFVSLSFSYSF